MSKPHQINLTHGAATILSQVLNIAGSAKDVVELYRAGQINEDHLSAIPPRPSDEDGDDYKAWLSQMLPTFTLTERQRETAKVMVLAAIKGIPPSKHANVLLRELGLNPEGE